jgi:ADP-heptose:LPS heptosyltransferase
MKLWIEKTGWASARCKELVRSMSPGEVESVAVIKHGALGDLILTRPFLVSLRRFFPRARITLSIAGNYTSGAPSDLADRTHISVAASAPGENALTAYRSFLALGAHDILFDLTETARSRWISQLNSALVKVGFSRANAGLLLSRFIYDILVPRTEYKFEAETFLDQLQVFGWSTDGQADFGFGAKALPEPIVAYFPTASNRVKCWPAERFSQLLGALSGEFRNLRHVVLSGKDTWEKEVAHAVAGPYLAAGNVEVASPPPGDLGLLQRATLVISNDTGIRNYAVAFGTPTLGIFFNTLPFRYRPDFGFHRVVFEAEGRIPSLDQVLQPAREMLTAPAGNLRTPSPALHQENT